MHDQIEKAEGIENSGSQEFRVARDFNVIRSTFVGFDPIDNELLQLFLAHQSYSYRAYSYRAYSYWDYLLPNDLRPSDNSSGAGPYFSVRRPHLPAHLPPAGDRREPVPRG